MQRNKITFSYLYVPYQIHCLKSHKMSISFLSLLSERRKKRNRIRFFISGVATVSATSPPTAKFHTVQVHLQISIQFRHVSNIKSKEHFQKPCVSVIDIIWMNWWIFVYVFYKALIYEAHIKIIILWLKLPSHYSYYSI